MLNVFAVKITLCFTWEVFMIKRLNFELTKMFEICSWVWEIRGHTFRTRASWLFSNIL